MYAVTVYPESLSTYVSQIYAGLYDLAAADKIKLSFADHYFHSTRKFDKYKEFTLWIKVRNLDSGQCCKIFFDMRDGMAIDAMDDLKMASVYVKRSCYYPYLNQLEQNLFKKIIPYGLHYDCHSYNEPVGMRLQQVYLYHLIHHNFPSSPIPACKQTIGKPLKLFLKKMHYRCNSASGLKGNGRKRCSHLSRFITRAAGCMNLPLFADDFEVHPDAPSEPKIYFQTRVYSPEEAPGAYHSGQLVNINGMRANTVRTLRKHFGEQFFGGLKRSPFAEKHYPDLITDFLNKKEHINCGKKYLICINTTGLHDSTGWKFPEQLAASRCIVSEPLKFELPVPVEKQKHYLPFTTTDECVDACRRILNDSKLASSMRQENYAYYRKHVRPSKIILSCMERALSKQLSLSEPPQKNT